MSIVEKVILISACVMPILALLFFLPKKLKLKKSKPTVEKEETVLKPQTPPPMPQAPQPNNGIGVNEEFKQFAQNKSRQFSAPKRNFPAHDFTFNSYPDNFAMSKPKAKTEKTLLEEINSLSPQLKALILSGAFDRKDFDD